MNTMYLSLAGNINICCLNDNNKCYFYAEHDYETDILDLLYNYIISCEINKINVILQGNWAPKPSDNSYVTGRTRISNAQFVSSVSQIDVNKLVHLFKAANVEDFTFIDRFAIYQEITKNEKETFCIIDRLASSILLLVVSPADEANQMKEIFYILPNNLSKYINMLKRKYNPAKFVDLNNYELPAVAQFEKFQQTDAIKIAQLISIQNATDEMKLNNNKIAFSSNFNSYDVEENEEVSVASTEIKEKADAVESLTEEVPKKSGKGTSVLLTILIILCMLSILGVVLINKLIDGDIESLKHKLKSVQIELSNDEQLQNQFEENENTTSYEDVFNNVNITEVPGIELAYVELNNDCCIANYYVKDTSDEQLTDLIHRYYSVDGVYETGSSVKNGITYYQKSFEITY